MKWYVSMPYSGCLVVEADSADEALWHKCSFGGRACIPIVRPAQPGDRTDYFGEYDPRCGLSREEIARRLFDRTFERFGWPTTRPFRRAENRC